MIIKKIPVLPLSALIFYIIVIILWNLNLIPEPQEIIIFLEDLHREYGYLSLVVATFAEGIAYLCLYVPGAFIIALTVFFSENSFMSLLTISSIVTIVLTVTSFINYFLGRYVATRKFSLEKEFVKESEMLSAGFLLSMLHPNMLAFYFFNAGLERMNLKKVLFVPLFMIPYGMVIAYGLSSLSIYVKPKLENPSFLLVMVLLWFLVAYLVNSKSRKKKLSKYY